VCVRTVLKNAGPEGQVNHVALPSLQGHDHYVLLGCIELCKRLLVGFAAMRIER
jgi:hypothetical protein